MYPNIINPYGQYNPYNPYVMPKHLAKSLKKLSKVPLDPFTPATVNFYDPLTGKQGPPYSPYGNMDVQTYSDNGSEVSITGSADDVDRVMGLLRNATFSQASGEPKYLPIGDPFDKTASGSTDSTSTGYGVTPTRFGRAMILSTPAGTQQFSGSGILLLEKIGPHDANVILVYTRRNTCEDMGGSLDSRLIPGTNVLADNAKKEMSEESQNLFLVNKLKLDSPINGSVSRSVDIQTNPSSPYYRCYIVCIQHAGTVPDLPSLFANNRTAMASEPGMEWRESLNLVKFKLQTLCTACEGNTGNVNCVDVMGRTQTVYARVVSVVNKLLAENRPTLRAALATPITVSPTIQSTSSSIMGYPGYGYMGGLNQVTSFSI